MRLVRFTFLGRPGPYLGLIADGEETVRDLTATSAPGCPLPWLRHLLRNRDRAVREFAAAARLAPVVGTLAELEASRSLLPPVDCPEVWAAGVTYERSRDARDRETQVGGAGGTAYDRVYAAERPELFFKATGPRVRGTGAEVGLRGDSRWQVPEPELGLVLDEDGTILGYTLGNDMSSRDIEGENPLYLPQAKIYRCACALGPAVLPAAGAAPAVFPIGCRVLRNGAEAWSGETDTGHMRRGFAELVGYLRRHNWIPAGTVLLTGTGLVPPDDFTLQAGDTVEITSPTIGTLRNTAAWV